MQNIPPSSLPNRQLLKLALLANTFEWYEFSVYGYLSILIGQLFFDSNPTLGLLKAFLSLAIGYFARPFGSLLFGLLGDRYGRQYTLRMSFLLMAIPTAIMGFLPTYDQAGFWATAALLLLRIAQGLAAGGDSPLTACYVFEGADKNYKSLLCSAAAAGPIMGMLLGSGITYSLMVIYDQTTLLAWGWRIPFFLSIPMSIFVGHVRNTLTETPEFLNKKPLQKSATLPWRALISPLVTAFFIFALLNAQATILQIWMPFYLHHFIGVARNTANLTNIFTLMSLPPLYLLCGLGAQRWGYQRILISSIIACLIFVIPLFYALQQTTYFIYLLLIQIVLALLVSSSNGLYVEVVGNLFPFEHRSLGISLACTLPATLISGTVPFVCTYALHQTGWLLFPAFYIMGFALLALPFAWRLK